MNKAYRNQIQKQKFKRRLKMFGMKMTSASDWKCYRTTSTPCSCAICSPGKNLETGIKKKNYKELQLQLSDLYEETKEISEIDPLTADPGF